MQAEIAFYAVGATNLRVMSDIWIFHTSECS